MSTFAGRYSEMLFKHVGNRVIPATSATVTVYESDGTTEASLYTDRTKATAAANPVTPDAAGNLEFFVDPGTYVLSKVEDSSVVATNGVTVFNDPAESGTGAVDSVNGATGTVVLDADDISDTSTTKKFTTAARTRRSTASRRAPRPIRPQPRSSRQSRRSTVRARALMPTCSTGARRLLSPRRRRGRSPTPLSNPARR